ncbi:hypothetical protein J2T09_005236 [Neorhizobium huautlense]|uniref:Transmembrane protein n=1 Tax=Neorhizobium huautlense TaxID=67774 RepID=A0ABT9Q161_9HYPH|nr:hypothetical protein [Neorhizobium huautlense]MDP9840449.1 hypothetical protein [Neorhizobium huautlense]
MDDEIWKTVRTRQRPTYRSGRTGALNVALLFGTAAIALSLIVTPMLAKRGEQDRMAHIQQDFDMITTGSIKRNDDNAIEKNKHYTIRRSVLQDTPGSVCIVQGYSSETGC